MIWDLEFPIPTSTHLSSLMIMWNILKTKIENLLSINGFTISDSNEFYKCEILADIRGQEYGKVFIIYPQLSIIIKNNEGLGISSFARQLEKVSSYTQETTERIALNKIENELESCFIKECFSYEYN